MYDAFARKDEPALRGLLAHDVEWNQCPGFPGGERRKGVEEVLAETFGGLRSAWRGFDAEAEGLHASGMLVFAVGRYSGIHAETGKAMEALFAHIYEVRDGRIVRYQQYCDTVPMVAAMTQ
jgi:uncharacterized protein